MLEVGILITQERSPRPVCTKRYLHGCLYPQPEPDPENARCCYRPTFLNVHKDRKAIPSAPGCSLGGECEGCRGHWADRNGVQPFEAPTHTFDEMLDELGKRLKRS